MNRLHPLNWIQWLTLFLTVAVAVIVAVLVIQGRNAAASRNQGLRTFICYFEQAALHPKSGPQPTPEKRRVIIDFFDGVMAKLHEPPCSTQ